MVGVGAGTAYEEMFGIGTWHSYHQNTDKVNICFTPPSGCGSLIAKEIAEAKSSIYMQAYGLTSKPIIYQLKQARKLFCQALRVFHYMLYRSFFSME